MPGTYFLALGWNNILDSYLFVPDPDPTFQVIREFLKWTSKHVKRIQFRFFSVKSKIFLAKWANPTPNCLTKLNFSISRPP